MLRIINDLKYSGFSVKTETYTSGMDSDAPKSHRPKDIKAYLKSTFHFNDETIDNFLSSTDLSDRQPITIVECSAGTVLKQLDGESVSEDAHANRYFVPVSKDDDKSESITQRQSHYYIAAKKVTLFVNKRKCGEDRLFMLSDLDKLVCIDGSPLLQTLQHSPESRREFTLNLFKKASVAVYLKLTNARVAADPQFAGFALNPETPYAMKVDQLIPAFLRIKSNSLFNFLGALGIRLKHEFSSDLQNASRQITKQMVHALSAQQLPREISLSVNCLPERPVGVSAKTTHYVDNTLQSYADEMQVSIINAIQDYLMRYYNLSDDVSDVMLAINQACGHAAKQFNEKFARVYQTLISNLYRTETDRKSFDKLNAFIKVVNSRIAHDAAVFAEQCERVLFSTFISLYRDNTVASINAFSFPYKAFEYMSIYEFDGTKKQAFCDLLNKVTITSFDERQSQLFGSWYVDDTIGSAKNARLAILRHIEEVEKPKLEDILAIAMQCFKHPIDAAEMCDLLRKMAEHVHCPGLVKGVQESTETSSSLDTTPTTGNTLVSSNSVGVVTEEMMSDLSFTESTAAAFIKELDLRLSATLSEDKAFDIEELPEYKAIDGEHNPYSKKYKSSIEKNLSLTIYDLRKKILMGFKNHSYSHSLNKLTLLQAAKLVKNDFTSAIADFNRHIQLFLDGDLSWAFQSANERDNDEEKKAKIFAARVKTQVNEDIAEFHKQFLEILTASLQGTYPHAKAVHDRETAEHSARLASSDPQVAFTAYDSTLSEQPRSAFYQSRTILKECSLMETREEQMEFLNLFKQHIGGENSMRLLIVMQLLRGAYLLQGAAGKKNVILLLTHPQHLECIDDYFTELERNSKFPSAQFAEENQAFLEKLITKPPQKVSSYRKLERLLVQLREYARRRNDALFSKNTSSAYAPINKPAHLANWLMSTVNEPETAFQLLNLQNGNQTYYINNHLINHPVCIQRMLDLIFTNDPILPKLVKILSDPSQLEDICRNIHSKDRAVSNTILAEWFNHLVDGLQQENACVKSGISQ